MRLENNLEEEGGKFDVPLGVVGGAVGGFTGYFVAGGLSQITMFPEVVDVGVSSVVLAGFTIGGYHALIKGKNAIGESFVGQSVKKVKKKINRRIARNSALREINLDKEFSKRQGIEGEFGSVRKGLNYALTVPMGGVLGYFSGIVGITPMCIYFGKDAFGRSVQSANLEPAMDSGCVAGAIVGGYAFAKMTGKKQHERLTTTASVLTGIAAAHISFAGNIFPRGIIEGKIEPGIFEYLGGCLASGLIAGVAGNLVYKGMKKGEEKLS